jgi:hypothetical protein
MGFFRLAVMRAGGCTGAVNDVGWRPQMLGAARTRQHAQPPARADALAEIELLDGAGEPVRMGDLWRDRPVVLVWLRHYG